MKNTDKTLLIYLEEKNTDKKVKEKLPKLILRNAEGKKIDDLITAHSWEYV